jgi:hypothetical protein
LECWTLRRSTLRRSRRRSRARRSRRRGRRRCATRRIRLRPSPLHHCANRRPTPGLRRHRPSGHRLRRRYYQSGDRLRRWPRRHLDDRRLLHPNRRWAQAQPPRAGWLEPGPVLPPAVLMREPPAAIPERWLQASQLSRPRVLLSWQTASTRKRATHLPLRRDKYWPKTNDLHVLSAAVRLRPGPYVPFS